VASNNITRVEAADRAQLLRVHDYQVELDLTRGERVFTSRTRVVFDARPGASTFLELIADRVHAVTLNGAALDVATVVADGRIQLDGLAATNTVDVLADGAYSHTGEGLHRFVDRADGKVYTYSQMEPADTKRVFACFDQPDLKATFQFSVTAPATWQVVSNQPTPQPEPGPDGAATWRFAPTARISPYITAVVAGEYHVVRDHYAGPAGEIPLGVFCRASLASHLDAAEILEVTHQGLTFFAERFGRPYPFTKYDQLFVPEFNAGAMENAGAVTFRDDFVFRSRVTDAARDSRANTVLHEMAHMWFGDLVTMRWWDDLWLNESFAEFMAYLAESQATRFVDAWTSFATSRKAWGYRQDQLPSTHPVAANAVDLETARSNFDGITYAKGASVLKQLVSWVGIEEFFAGVRAYFDAHEWGNTSLQDLLVELEATSGRDLGQWSKEWLETPGVNTLRPAFTLDADGHYASFAVEQEAAASHPTLRSHRLRIGLYDLADGRLVRRDVLETDVVGASTDIPALAGVAQPDLLLLNDDDLTFAKIRLDERSHTTLTRSIATIDASLTRAIGWMAAWDMTRDAELAGRDFLRLVTGLVAGEADITTVQTLLRQAATVIDVYVSPDARAATKAAYASSVRGFLLAAEPGSDHQLAFARIFAATASTGDQLAVLAGLLDGTQAIPGLAVDTELRWALLYRLVQRGERGMAAVDAELARDATASGERHATAARAALPTPAAKAAAWAAVMETDELSNDLLVATLVGFMDPDHRELLRPYADRYFSQIPSVFATRSAETSETLAAGLYPALFVEEATVSATEALAATPGLPAMLERTLREGADGVRRAMRCQERDGRPGT